MADTFRVKVAASSSQGAMMLLAREFQLSVDAARQLLSKARVLPRDMDEPEAQRVAEALRRFGVSCEAVKVAAHSKAVCGAHPSLTPERPCADCRKLVCVLCKGPEGEPMCPDCASKRTRRKQAQWVRVGVLLSVLVFVGVWGTSRQRDRSKRLEWKRPVKVAVVLLPRGELKPEVQEAWKVGLEQLEAWVAREAERYKVKLKQPVDFVLAGPVPAGGLVLEPPEDGLLDRTSHAWALSKTLAGVDKAAKVRPDKVDARIYVMLEPSEGEDRFVEGMAEAGGSVGLVRGVLGETDLTLELTAVAHELFHCLGAVDAYDVNGHALVPQGLAEPKATPVYPQAAAEVMVGEVPLELGQGRLPASLDEVRVGPTTAAALHWTK